MWGIWTFVFCTQKVFQCIITKTFTLKILQPNSLQCNSSCWIKHHIYRFDTILILQHWQLCYCQFGTCRPFLFSLSNLKRYGYLQQQRDNNRFILVRFTGQGWKSSNNIVRKKKKKTQELKIKTTKRQKLGLHDISFQQQSHSSSCDVGGK